MLSLHRVAASLLFVCVSSWPQHGVLARTAADARPDWAKASWIWSHAQALAENNDACAFRRKFHLSGKPTGGMIAITADNAFDLYVNGQFVASDGGIAGDVWQSVEMFRIEEFLHDGPNVIAVRARNLGGPGGLAAAVHIAMTDGAAVSFETDAAWLASTETASGWTEADHDDSLWTKAVRLGNIGIAPWGHLDAPRDASPAGQRGPQGGKFTEPGKDFSWPAGVAFVSGVAPLNSTAGAPQAKWDIGGSRAFFEHDTPTPSAVGRRLCALVPAGPRERPRVLVDAGRGVLGSPACSYDGREIVFAMAPEGERYFNLFRVAVDGSGLARLTDGPWHDYDPEFLPDGRIAFASTRIGSRDEYHGNTARCLFALSVDRTSIDPLTQHIVGDTQPRVMADGRIAFVRSDNFLERAKVETHIHAVRADGTGGEVLLGPNRGAIGYDRATAAEDDGSWLRTFGFGCLAPLPDGRVACLSHEGLIVSARARSHSGATGQSAQHEKLPSDVPLFDIAPLPDGRLLCTVQGQGALAVLDPASGKAVRLLTTDAYDVHSVVYLGPRSKPPIISSRVAPAGHGGDSESGVLVCQNVFASKQTEAEWPRVKAVRLFMGNPFTLRAARHPYGHVGVEAVELGTVPLASDGSFHIRVPADRALALQAVDAEGRAVVNELSWIYVRPGERRSCTGCHEQRQLAPTHGLALAARLAPVDLTGGDSPHRFRGNNAANGGVLNLQLDRFREVASINLYPQEFAADNAAEFVPSRAAEIARLTRLLRKEIAPRRSEAAARLALFRDRTAAPALAEALADAPTEERIQIALALAACGGKECLTALAALLSDDDANVSQAATIALEHITGHREQFDPYDGRTARRQGRQQWETWLTSVDWTAVESNLVHRAASRDASEAQLAIEALARVGGDAAAVWLRSAVERGEWPSLTCELAAIRALGQLRDAAATPVLAAVLERNITAPPVQPAKSHEFGWSQVPVQRSGAAAEALGRIGTPGAEEALLAAASKLAPAWHYAYQSGDHEWLMGCHASIPHFRLLEALDAIGSRRAGPLAGAILRAIPIDTDRGLLFENDAYEAITARVLQRAGVADDIVETCLSVLGDPHTTPMPELVEAVTASPPAISVGPHDPQSRAAQILSILCVKQRDAGRMLAAFERFQAGGASRTQCWVCFYLARALGKARYAAAAPRLIAALAEQPTETHHGVPLPPNVFLFEAMTPMYRAAAADALGRIRSPEATPVLWAVINDYGNAMDVRHAAARSLTTTATPQMLPALESAAENYPELVTRRALKEAWQSAHSRSISEPQPARPENDPRTGAVR
ncbi:MAG: HEAT repeat domain-containing protein [Pirellulales bacterium]